MLIKVFEDLEGSEVLVLVIVSYHINGLKTLIFHKYIQKINKNLGIFLNLIFFRVVIFLLIRHAVLIFHYHTCCEFAVLDAVLHKCGNPSAS
jgi:hypothetical protein